MLKVEQLEAREVPSATTPDVPSLPLLGDGNYPPIPVQSAIIIAAATILEGVAPPPRP